MNGHIQTQRSVIHTEGRIRPCHLQKKQMEVEDTIAHKYWDTECQVMSFLFLVCGKLKQNKTKQRASSVRVNIKDWDTSEWGIRQSIVGRVNMWLAGKYRGGRDVTTASCMCVWKTTVNKSVCKQSRLKEWERRHEKDRQMVNKHMTNILSH